MDFRTQMGLKLMELEEQRLRGDQLLEVLAEVALGTIKPNRLHVDLPNRVLTVLPLQPANSIENEKKETQNGRNGSTNTTDYVTENRLASIG